MSNRKTDTEIVRETVERIKKTTQYRTAIWRGFKSSRRFWAIVRLSEPLDDKTTLFFGPFQTPKDSVVIRNKVIKMVNTKSKTAISPDELKFAADPQDFLYK